jgi:ATP-binding cassette subfamily B protein
MFIRTPELYVIDDLSSALDDQTEQHIWHRIDGERAQATTYLVVSHRASALHRADQIISLAEGRIESAGTLAELKRTSPVIQRIIGHR